MARRAAKNNTLLTLALAAALVLVLYARLGIWPFGDGTVLTGDLNGQYINYFAHFRRALLAGEGFGYGFDKALGGGLLGIFAYYASSPFNLLYLLTDPAGYADVAALVLALKLVAASGAMTFYLDRHNGGCGRLAIPLGLGYGFMTYAIVYAQNIMWHDAVLLLPLVCLGIDRIVAGRTPLLFALALAVAIFANFYIGYMVCIFAVGYFLWAMLLCPAAPGQRGAFWRGRCLRFAAGALPAGFASGALLLPALANIQGSKGELLAYSFSAAPTFALARLPAQLLPGNFLWQDVTDGLPNIYCGLLAAVGVLAFFCRSGISKKEKLLSGAFFAALLLSLWVRGTDTLWHGLKQPVWFPFRQSFLVCFLALVLAARALHGLSFTRRGLLAFLGANAALLALAVAYRSTGMGGRRLPLAVLLWCAFAALAALLALAPARRQRAVLALCLLLTCGELALNAGWAADQFEKYPRSEYRSFVQRGTAAVQALGAGSGSGFRLEKNFFRSLNDAMLLGYHGTAHFGSTQDSANAQVLDALGYRSYGGSNSYGCGSTAFADSLLGVRYLLADGVFPVGSHYAAAGALQGWDSYENPDAFPIGVFLAGELPQQTDGSGLATFDYQNSLYTALSGDSAPLFETVSGVAASENGAAVPLAGSFENAREYRFTAASDGIYYAVLTGDGGLPLDLSIDGKTVAGGYFTADQSGVIDLGRRKAGETVTFALRPRQGSGSVSGAVVCCMDESRLAALAERLRADNTGLRLAEGTASGTAASAAGGWYLLQIPYEKSLVLTVDGAPAQLVPAAGGFAAVRLAAGSHQLVIRYRAPAQTAGWAVTAVGLAGLAALAGWDAREHRGRKKEDAQ